MTSWNFTPSHEQAAAVTGLLASRKTVFRHVLPSGVHIEVAHVGTADLTWLVVWSAPASEPWPDMYPEESLMRVQMDDRRQQTWAFMDERAYVWETLLKEAWGLAPDLRCEGLA
jgi:hypothetical protein